MVTRVVHLGFEVRVELELPDGEPARAQLTRGQSRGARARPAGDIVYVRARPRRPDVPGEPADADRSRSPQAATRRTQRVTQASGSSASLSIAAGSFAGGDVGERHVLDHAAQVRADRDPDPRQRSAAPG